jgi:ATP-dependent DNA helicase RecG
MKIVEISKTDAIDFCARDEDQYYDRKSKEISGKKVQKIAVALANSDGGEFVIGIKDDKQESNNEKKWNGADKIEDFNGQLQSLTEITPSLPLKYEVLQCTHLPGYVLHLFIDKSSKVHNCSNNLVYQRIGAQSIKISDPQKIIELSFAKGETTYEDSIISTIPTEQISEGKEIKEFLHDFSPKTDPIDYLSNSNLMDFNTWEPRVCCLLLYHSDPPSVLTTRCSVKIARYETREDDPERDHLAGTWTIAGPLYRLIHGTVNKISEIMSSVSIWTSEGLQKVKYPPEAIWEIVVNAIIHRDYSISDDVLVLIYNDRIEVKSPGKLPGFVTVDNILDVRFSRNPKIVRTLNRYKNPPNKDLGEGLNTTYQKMKDWKLKTPIIKEENNYVNVILPNTPLAQPTELIIEFLSKFPEITNRQARDLTGIRSENLVKVEFYKLKNEDLIEMVPGKKGPASAWRLKK